MARVLKIGLSLFGGVGLLLVATLWLARQADESRWLIVRARFPTEYDSLSMVNIDKNVTRRLTPNYLYFDEIEWNNGRLYYTAYTQDALQYYSIGLHDLTSHLLLNGTALDDKPVTHSPDGEWVFYFASNQLIRSKPDGSESIVLNPPGSYASDPVLLSPDGKWVIFSAVYSRPNPATSQLESIWDIYRVRIADGSRLENLTYDVDANNALGLWLPNSEWLIVVSWRDGLYRLRADGWQLTRLNMQDVERIQDWIPQAETLIINSEYSIYGFRVSTNEILWKLSYFVYYTGHSPDGQWVVFNARHDLLLMRVDGTQRTVLSRNNAFGDAVWTPDSRWIAFVRFNAIAQRMEIWRRRLEDGYEELVATNNHAIVLRAWSPDGNWLIFWQFRGEEIEGLFRVRVDGTDEEEIASNLLYPEALLWLPPIGRHWQPALLMLVAGLCLVAPPLLTRRPPFRHPPSSRQR